MHLSDNFLAPYSATLSIVASKEEVMCRKCSDCWRGSYAQKKLQMIDAGVMVGTIFAVVCCTIYSININKYSKIIVLLN